MIISPVVKILNDAKNMDEIKRDFSNFAVTSKTVVQENSEN